MLLTLSELMTIDPWLGIRIVLVTSPEAFTPDESSSYTITLTFSVGIVPTAQLTETLLTNPL